MWNTVDVCGYSDFYFDVVKIDAVSGFKVVLTLTDDDSASIIGDYDATTVGVYLTNIGSMTIDEVKRTVEFAFGEVISSATSISSLRGKGNDFQLATVGLAAVPEISALAILGIGLIELELCSRKLT